MPRTRNPPATRFLWQEDLHLDPACMPSEAKWDKGEKQSARDSFGAPTWTRSEASLLQASQQAETNSSYNLESLDPSSSTVTHPAARPPRPVPLALAEVLPPLTGQESHGSAPQLPPPTEPVQNPCPPRPRSSRRSPLISLHWDCRGGRAQQSWTGVQTRGSGAGRRRVSSSRDPEQPSLRCRILFACGGGRN